MPNTCSPRKRADKGHQEENEQDKEQNLGDTSRGDGDSSKSEDRGDDCDDETRDSPTQHFCASLDWRAACILAQRDGAQMLAQAGCTFLYTKTGISTVV